MNYKKTQRKSPSYRCQGKKRVRVTLNGPREIGEQGTGLFQTLQT